MVNLRPWIDLTPERPGAATASQLQQSDATLLGVVTELVDAQNVAVAIDGVGDAAPDVVCPGSGRMWVGARVRCIRDSTGRVVRVEALADGVLDAPPLGFVHGPEDLVVDAQGRPRRIEEILKIVEH